MGRKQSAAKVDPQHSMARLGDDENLLEELLQEATELGRALRAAESPRFVPAIVGFYWGYIGVIKG